MNKEYLLNLIKYNFLMNRKIFFEIIKNNEVSEKALRYFCHILAAEKIWMKRLEEKEWNGIEVWPVLKPEEIETMINENETDFTKYVIQAAPALLTSSITYKNIKGIEYSNSVEDVLMHIIIHGAYHRAQFATAIKEDGLEPVNTDYIAYKRELEI